MKKVSLCFVINSVHHGKKIICKIPQPTENVLISTQPQDKTQSQSETAETLVERFLDNTKIRISYVINSLLSSGYSCSNNL